MLIRIVPKMFEDPKYKCTTVVNVKNELYRTAKFNKKFPWRKAYKANIKTVGMLELEGEMYKENYELVKNILDAGIINQNTMEEIDLSGVDKVIAAYAVTNQYEITTGDKNLAAFLEQEFELNNIKPLEIINQWIKEGLLNIDENIMGYLQGWINDDEPVQPKNAMREFEKITGKTYPK